MPQSHIVATKTPTRSNRCRQQDRTANARGDDKFEFDAPQFEDFTLPRYSLQRRLLEEAVLPAEQRTEWTVVEYYKGVIEGEESETDDEWFQRAHREHEPTSPLSPASPLISPLAPSSNDERRVTAASSVGRSPLFMEGGGTFPHSLTHSSPRQQIGLLRAKPMRVPIGSGSGGARNSADNSSRTSATSFNATNFFAFSDMSQMKSPTDRRAKNRVWQVTTVTDERSEQQGRRSRVPRTSASIEDSLIAGDYGEDPINDLADIGSPLAALPPTISDSMRKSSLPVSTNWSSIPATPPILASNLLKLLDDELTEQRGRDQQERKRSLPITSPIPPVISSMGATRRIGLAARAVRVPAATVTGMEAVDLQQRYLPVTASPLAKQISPVIKRVKVDARFCPAPPLPTASKSKNTSPPNGNHGKSNPPPVAATTNRRGPPDKPVKLDDLKKLLAEHNQKLRPHHPHSNITRRR